MDCGQDEVAKSEGADLVRLVPRRPRVPVPAHVARLIDIAKRGHDMEARLNATRIAAHNADAEGIFAARRFGFRPAFLDFTTMQIHPSSFADGEPSPFHVLDGLPDEAVLERSSTGRVTLAKPTLICGFERRGFFYPRAAAARACAEWGGPLADSSRTPPRAVR